MKPIFLLLPFAALFAQDSFEVASIKPVDATDNRIQIMMQPGGRFVANGATVQMLVTIAYELRPQQVSGGPAWVRDQRFSINAKAADGVDRIPQEQFRKLLKNLLADRFGLKVHEEEKEGSIFHLVQAKSGHKLVEAKDASGPGGRMMVGRGRITANGMRLEDLARMLGQQVGRNVIDKTALTGRYDVDIEFTPDPGMGGGFGPPPGAGGHPPAIDTGGPTLFTAIEEKLGLKLESAKGMIKTLVIDDASKPTDN
jgi:uncharacterized protein (TIGR03435 family)